MSECHVSRNGQTATLPQHHIARLGWKPDKPDARDLVVPAPMVVHLPERVDLRASGCLPPVYDQDVLGSCTANAIGAAYEYLQRKTGLQDYMPSRLFIYYGEREIEGTTSYDAGAEIRDGLKVIAKLGVPDEQLWPYDIPRFTQRPSQAAYVDALKHQCITYRRVGVNETSVRHALAQGYPVIFGFSVPESFEGDAIATSGVMDKPAKDEPIVGGHAVLAVGYERQRGAWWAIVRNSWGPSWGDGGYFVMPLAWMCNPNNADDFWIIQSVEA